MGRKSERRGIFGKPQPAPVHRLHMLAPERLQGNRTGVRTHAVAVAARALASLRRPFLAPLFRLFLAQFPQIFRTFAPIFRAHQMAHSQLKSLRRKLAPAAIFLRLKTARYQVASCVDQHGLLALSQER
ncbi:hypothetical protein X772_31830 [Mesorhizobium sp. LSJC280B00]|nr:hypothetical protein X772_31830 [Mesorhizobium sp. LSJC280B00]